MQRQIRKILNQAFLGDKRQLGLCGHVFLPSGIGFVAYRCEKTGFNRLVGGFEQGWGDFVAFPKFIHILAAGVLPRQGAENIVAVGAVIIAFQLRIIGLKAFGLRQIGFVQAVLWGVDVIDTLIVFQINQKNHVWNFVIGILLVYPRHLVEIPFAAQFVQGGGLGFDFGGRLFFACFKR